MTRWPFNEGEAWSWKNPNTWPHSYHIRFAFILFLLRLAITTTTVLTLITLYGFYSSSLKPLSLSLLMAESHHKLSICLLTAMDYLWFHHAILLSQPTSLLVPKAPLKTHSLSPNQYSLSSTPVDIQDPEKSSASAQVSPLVTKKFSTYNTPAWLSEFILTIFFFFFFSLQGWRF